MAHSSKRNRRHTTAQDGDDYVYPTKKVRESKTRNRKHGTNLIKAGLVDYENPDQDDEDPTGDLEALEDYNEMITEYNDLLDEQEEDDDDYEYTYDDDNGQDLGYGYEYYDRGY